ncbi:YopX family protein [Bacillus velezensis]|uniref:YopX family protein n=1 Tax=Bacillus velezensis TaxID=492670 RepID=UPI00280890BC|nr:YopX family protein [Bacillus velezensis]MDQ8054938.1 YopX family protein [Bacillus velezensis]
MNNIKIRYVFRHKETGNVELKTYFISQLEERPARKLSPVFCEEFGYELISRDLFSGTKDKNGKEIYQGDVIMFSFIDEGEKNTRFMQIVFEGSGFKMKEICRNYRLEKIHGVLRIKRGTLTDHQGKLQELHKHNDLYFTEIIGNVHQNPELLGGAAE